MTVNSTQNCELCGEPMPEGEPFRYHGFSGECPKPPLKSSVINSTLREEVHRLIVESCIKKNYLMTSSSYPSIAANACSDQLVALIQRRQEITSLQAVNAYITDSALTCGGFYGDDVLIQRINDYAAKRHKVNKKRLAELNKYSRKLS